MPRRPAVLVVSVLFLLALTGVARGAPGDTSASRVADLIPGTDSSFPEELTDVNGTLFFVTDTGLDDELWRSDGTAAGTVMVEDSVPGGGINPGGSSDPSELTNVNGTLFFAANDGNNGNELWRSDGTPAGTVMVEDAVAGGGINPLGGSSNPAELANVNGTLFFSANDGTNGRELWRYDGTTAMLVEDAVAGGGINPLGGSSNPAELANFNATLYFRANDGTNGAELWKYDGTTAVIVEDAVVDGGINPVGGSSTPAELANVNGTLFFSANDGTNGRELWRYDGTTAMLVEDAVPGGGINPGSAGSFPESLTNLSGTLFFSANDGSNGIELWRSDGTSGGTVMVEDAVPGGGINPGGDDSEPGGLSNINGTLFFGANDGSDGAELWRSDGTPAGTVMVRDINPGAGSSDPELDDPTHLGGVLYFVATDGTNGRELWTSDGTAAGTAMVEDSVPGGGLNPGGADSHPSWLVGVNGSIYFAADDGTTGRELWRATIEGPARPVDPVTPINPVTPSPPPKRCKKGLKLRKGKCVKKKRKRK